MICGRVLALAVVCAAVLLPGASAKLAVGSFKLDSDNCEKYLSKFSFSVGEGFIAGNFTFGGKFFDHFRHDLRVYLFSDVGIAKYNEMMRKGSLCRDRMREAAWSTKISPDRTAKEGQEFVFDTEVHVVGRTHYWYAIVGDCWLEEYDAHPPVVDYTISFLDRGHTHLPADEQGLLQVHLMLLLVLIGFGAYVAHLMYKQFLSDGQLHLVTFLLCVAYVTHTLSVLCELLHLRRYSQDGMGLRWTHTLFALDQASSVLQGFSELILAFLLVSVGCGWTLVHSISLGSGVTDLKGDKPSFVNQVIGVLKSPKKIMSRVGPASLFFPVLAAVDLYLELWGHSYDDDFNQFHDFEHLPGHLAMALRLLLCLLFLAGVRLTLSQTPHVLLADFLRRFRIAGVVWFMSFPLLVLSTFMFPPHVRHKVVTGASLIIQTTALAVVSYEIASKSEYFKLSSLSQVSSLSGITPSRPGKSKLAVD